MCPKYHLLLIFGIILSLPHPSSSQNWATFQQKHIVGSANNINCYTQMQNSIFIIMGRCKPVNTFIVSSATTVKAICSAVSGRADVSSSSRFQLITCRRASDVTPPCPYNTKNDNDYICIRCENRHPVHFVKMGKC
ncbi:PREDICTED: sialic acid-binding lectin-like [Nanorana parkeri]|uniref:sialic acid-binding lectin-like n=1 Tax=Nanorana parkeri TaxID=125878 RepID=UPI0008548ADB|nr:PREDICTED: sialic acid-binding lectin-like [Nanorana parkeri]